MDGIHRLQREQLWLAIRLPHLPLEVLAPESSPTPLVVSEKKRVEVVVCLNAAAEAAGVSFGMECVRAQILSECEARARDRALEQRRLVELADELYRFSPYIEIYECEPIAQAGVLLEISKCLALFGGLSQFVEQVQSFLATTPHRTELGMAHSGRAAWLLSWSDQPFPAAGSRSDFLEQLKPLPVGLLHEFPAAVSMLQKTGFVTLGDVARQIRAQSISGLKKRLNREFIEYINDVFGIDQDLQQRSLFQKPVVQYKPLEIYRDEIQFEYPVSNTEQLRGPIEVALQNLNEYLRNRQRECQEIHWSLRDIHKRSDEIAVRCDTGQSDWRLLYDLTLIQLDNRVLKFEVDRLILECPETTPLQNRDQALSFTRSRAKKLEQDLEIVVAKLKARLGDNSVYKLSYCDTHTPEAMAEAIPVNAVSNQLMPVELSTAVRPIWLFSEPYRAEKRERGVYWRGYFEMIEGPERIHDDWWQTPRARDYYIARRDDNGRFWIFQDVNDGGWFVHGAFA